MRAALKKKWLESFYLLMSLSVKNSHKCFLKNDMIIFAKYFAKNLIEFREI